MERSEAWEGRLKMEDLDGSWTRMSDKDKPFEAWARRHVKMEDLDGSWTWMTDKEEAFEDLPS